MTEYELFAVELAREAARVSLPYFRGAYEEIPIMASSARNMAKTGPTPTTSGSSIPSTAPAPSSPACRCGPI
jgi:hypothetical protein